MTLCSWSFSVHHIFNQSFLSLKAVSKMTPIIKQQAKGEGEESEEKFNLIRINDLK